MTRAGELWTLGVITILFLAKVTTGELTGPPESTWTVSNEICSDPPEGCSCPAVKDPSYTLVKCQCSHENQIVNLVGSKDRGPFSKSNSTTWIIESCSRVIIHRQALLAVNGNQFELQLINLSALDIKELAFELNSMIVTRNIIFNNVTIKSVPSRAFTSSLDSVRFLNCDISTVSYHAFKSPTLQTVLFENTRVGMMEGEAFYEGTLINQSWIVNNSKFRLIRSRGLASSISNMTWVDSTIETLEAYALSGIIPNSSFVRNHFGLIPSNGLKLDGWTWISFVNNTFERVEAGGIDLTAHASSFNLTELLGNEWLEVQTDFIKVGRGGTVPFTLVQDNRFLSICNCTPPFISQVTLNHSAGWFLDQLWNNTECPTTQKGAGCLGRPEGQTLISYADWERLCMEESMYRCLNDLSEMSDVSVYNPPSTGKLRLLAIFIGTVGLAIVVALVGVLLVYMCRTRQTKARGTEDDVQITKSLRIPDSQNPYSGILRPPVPPARPRSALFEDVEMEDKGVQTMPNELSSEVLEGLRDKLSDPDSFWDAKETIDHLYDLIHVKEESQSSRPPDVTISSPTSPHVSTSSPQISQPPPPRYAQIRSKPKTAPICEYSHPSDSQTHIYSELTAARRQVASRGTSACPTICEYTEPKDVQTHVYAELSSVPPACRPPLPPASHVPGRSFSRPRPVPGAPNRNHTMASGKPVQDQCPSSPTCQQRPLPSIPAPLSPTRL